MLQTLNLSYNSLKDLPETLSNLSRLKTFDITYNPKMKKLPKSLAHCHAIEKLSVIDGNAIQYPSSDVCQKGIVSIMQFLCKGEINIIKLRFKDIQFIMWQHTPYDSWRIILKLDVFILASNIFPYPDFFIPFSKLFIHTVVIIYFEHECGKIISSNLVKID